jgi:hypothetical protein
MDEFTDQAALVAGGWDPRFARVLAEAVVGASAVAIIDANGAQGGLVYENIDSYTWEPGSGWDGWIRSGGLSSGWPGGVAYASGSGTPGDSVVIDFEGEHHRVDVQPSGYWLFAAPGEDPDQYPTRVE